MPEIIIQNKPELKSVLRNITEMSFTSVIWVMWLYLFLPVLNLLLWVVGIKHFMVTVIGQLGYGEFFELVNNMGWIIMIVFLVLRLWGYYNYYVFGKKNRRKQVSPATIKQLAEQFKITEEEITNLQKRKEIHWDDAVGRINNL